MCGVYPQTDGARGHNTVASNVDIDPVDGDRHRDGASAAAAAAADQSGGSSSSEDEEDISDVGSDEEKDVSTTEKDIPVAENDIPVAEAAAEAGMKYEVLFVYYDV